MKPIKTFLEESLQPKIKKSLEDLPKDLFEGLEDILKYEYRVFKSRTVESSCEIAYSYYVGKETKSIEKERIDKQLLFIYMYVGGDIAAYSFVDNKIYDYDIIYGIFRNPTDPEEWLEMLRTGEKG